MVMQMRKKGFSSGALRLAEKINKNQNISVDIGQVMFKPTVTISSDIWKQNQAKSNANPKKWVISESKTEEGALYPMNISKKILLMRSNGRLVELFLMIKDPWRVFLQLTIQMVHHLLHILN